MSLPLHEQKLDQLDVSDPAIYQADAWHDVFARLRREAPVHFCADSPYGPYWSVSTYDAVSRMELDHGTFSSSHELGGIQIADQPAGQALPNFIRMDPPVHTAQRRTVAPIVAPTNLRNFEETIRTRTAEVLDALPKCEEIDWVTEVSRPLTTMMLATLFDFPWEDRDKLAYWSDVAIANPDDPDPIITSHEQRMGIMGEMARYFMALFQERGERPPQFDLISMMAHSPATQNMPIAEFTGNVGLLIVGGNDTTRNSMTGGALFLDQNPQEAEKLYADPGLVGSLVPEIIRYQSPVLHMRRTTTCDTELAGQQIPKGSRVVMWYMSANQDETAIEQADRFMIDRPKARRHLSFGAGIHRCVGDRLAEQQLRILWEEILSRRLRIRVTGEPKRLYSNFIRGIRSLPVVVKAP